MSTSSERRTKVPARINSQAGITLLEVMLAMSVTAMALLMSAHVLVESHRLDRTNTEEALVHERTKDVVEQLRQIDLAAAQEVLESLKGKSAEVSDLEQLGLSRLSSDKVAGLPDGYEISLVVPKTTEGGKSYDLEDPTFQWATTLLDPLAASQPFSLEEPEQGEPTLPGAERSVASECLPVRIIGTLKGQDGRSRQIHIDTIIMRKRQ